MTFSVSDILEEFVDALHVVEWVDWEMYRHGGLHIETEYTDVKSERQRRARQSNPALHKRLDHERYIARRDVALAQQREYYALRGKGLRDARVAKAREERRKVSKKKRPKTTITQALATKVMDMLAKGDPIYLVARTIPLSRTCIYNIIKKARVTNTERTGG